MSTAPQNPYGNITFNLSNGNLSYNPQTGQYVFNTVPCYNEGTKILCLINDIEEYKEIEKLRKGDLVKTVKDGYKKIDLIGKKNLFNNPLSESNCMYKISNENDELYVTGEHMILSNEIENITINEKYKHFYDLNYTVDGYKCILALDIGEKILNKNKYTIYHLVLESDNGKHFGIYANNILSESTNKDNFIKSNFEILN